MKNKKQQFLNAVRILAPNDSFILQLASRFDEASLPQFPGGVALKFVVAIQSLRAHRPVAPCRSRPGRGRLNPPPAAQASWQAGLFACRQRNTAALGRNGPLLGTERISARLTRAPRRCPLTRLKT
jgi:hypothetical protein